MYETGEGRIRIRAKAVIENGEYGKKNIVITEIPYTAAGNKTKLVEELAEAVRAKTFDEIADVRDESSKEGLRIVIEVKKDRDPENLLNGLYKKTSLEDTYGVNFIAVKDGQPGTFPLKSLLQEFIDFQDELYTKEYQYLLDRATKRLEVVSGLIRAVDVIDFIIEVLRGSKDLKQARECLMHGVIDEIRFKTEEAKRAAARFDFTERQADAILAMQLSKLVGLELLKLQQEDDELQKNIKRFNKILAKKSELYKVIEEQLLEFREKFAAPRKTVITTETTTADVVEEKIEDLMNLIDRFGYMKVVDLPSYQKASPENLQEFTHTCPIRSNDRLCIFTAQGNLYQLKVTQIPRAKLREKGTLYQTLTKIGSDEEAILFIAFEDLFNSQLLFVTKYGLIKQVSGVEFDTNRAVVNTTKLEDGDKIVGLTALSAKEVMSGHQKVVILTEKKLSLGFPLDEVPELKKTSKGVKAIALEKKDYVLYGTSLDQNTEEFTFDGKTYNAKKVRNRKRAAKGQKATL